MQAIVGSSRLVSGGMLFPVERVHGSKNLETEGSAMRLAGLSLAALAALLWATSGPFFRIAGSLDLDVIEMNLVRFSLCCMALLFVLAIRRGHRRCPAWSMLNPLFFLGSAGMVFSSLFLTLAFLRIPIGTSMVLFHTAPFWVMLGTWLFSRRKPTFLQLLAFVLALTGVWKTVGGARVTGPLDWLGVASALVAASGYALYVLNGHFGPGRHDGFGLYCRTFFVATAMIWIIAAASGRLVDLFQISAKAWFVLFYLALATALVPYGLLIAALRYISGSTATITTMSEIPFSMMWAFFILGERPGSGAVIGGILVLLGVGLITFERG
jgi:drug/metabolite transporter (DMT)-like permease